MDAAHDQVAVELSGLVSQDSGEDWPDAALTLSTAMPAVVTTLPRLDAWRIGERERFVPVSSSRPAGPPAPRPAAATPDQGPAPGTLRVFVYDQAGMPLGGVRVVASPVPGGSRTTYTNQDGFCRFLEVPVGKYEIRASAPKLREVILRDVAVGEGGGEANLVMEVDSAVEEVKVVESTPLVNTSSPSVTRALDRALPGDVPALVQLKPALTLAPPAATPRLRPEGDTAAALAGGYESAFPSPSPETVASGGQRRVSLQKWAWKATVERALYPGLDQDSYLVAILKTASDRPLPGGRAAIFIGDDPAGTADLTAFVPGQGLTLPLGVDRAIRAVRQVTVHTREAGLFWRREIDRHSVTIEITNPHAAPARLQVHDRIPISQDERVEVRLVQSSPAGRLDRDTGALSWRLELGPGASRTLQFSYELSHPKGHRTQQEAR